MHAQNLIVDGSPQWEIYRLVPVSAEGSSTLQSEPATARELKPSTVSSAEIAAAVAGGYILDSEALQSGVCSKLAFELVRESACDMFIHSGT